MRLGCDFDLGMRRNKEPPQLLARDAFVIDDESFHAGMDTIAATVWASRFSRRREACPP